jgi:transposase
MFVLGIDIGQDDLDARLLETPLQGPPTGRGQVRVFPNSQVGRQSLQDWLAGEQARPPLTSVVMEATGISWERLAVALHAAEFAVSVINAAQINFFARSTLRRGKTDAMDAEIIARYGVTMRPARWMPTEHTLEELRALIHERDTIGE